MLIECIETKFEIWQTVYFYDTYWGSDERNTVGKSEIVGIRRTITKEGKSWDYLMDTGRIQYEEFVFLTIEEAQKALRESEERRKWQEEVERKYREYRHMKLDLIEYEKGHGAIKI